MNKKRVYAFMLLLVLTIIINTVLANPNLPKTISIKLEYKSGSVWDSDDDGVEKKKMIAGRQDAVTNCKFANGVPLPYQ